MNQEAHIVINGKELSSAESLTLRVVIASALFDYSDPNFLGADNHGKIMTEHYRRSCENIQEYIFKIFDKNN